MVSRANNDVEDIVLFFRHIRLIERTMDTQSVLGSHMGVDHRGLQIKVAQQVLDGPNIISCLKQMGGKRAVRRRWWGWDLWIRTNSKPSL